VGYKPKLKSYIQLLKTRGGVQTRFNPQPPYFKNNRWGQNIIATLSTCPTNPYLLMRFSGCGSWYTLLGDYSHPKRERVNPYEGRYGQRHSLGCMYLSSNNRHITDSASGSSYDTFPNAYHIPSSLHFSLAYPWCKRDPHNTDLVSASDRWGNYKVSMVSYSSHHPISHAKSIKNRLFHLSSVLTLTPIDLLNSLILLFVKYSPFKNVSVSRE
jgi:hypothetical protein